MYSKFRWKVTFWTIRRPKGDQILHKLTKKSPKGDLVFHPARNCSQMTYLCSHSNYPRDCSQMTYVPANHQPGRQPQHYPHHVQYEHPGQCHVTVVPVQPSNSGSYGQILDRFCDYEMIICFPEFWKKTDRCTRKQFNQLLIFPFYNNVYMQTVFVIFISLLPPVSSDHATSDATYASTSSCS